MKAYTPTTPNVLSTISSSLTFIVQPKFNQRKIDISYFIGSIFDINRTYGMQNSRNTLVYTSVFIKWIGRNESI